MKRISSPSLGLLDTRFVNVTGDTMTGPLLGFFTTGTKDTILALTPADVTIAYATDVERFYIFDGTGWFESAVNFAVSTSAQDMGLEQESSKQGYGLDYINQKKLTYVKLGDAANNETGALKYEVDTNEFQVYSAGVWNAVVLGFRFREDSDGAYELEHKPVGFEWWYEVISGNSMDNLDLDGRPLVNQYTISMGAYARDLILNGGTF